MMETTTSAQKALLKPYCHSIVAPKASIARKLTAAIAVLVTVHKDQRRTDFGA